MNIFTKKPTPEEVFTPRSHDLNQKTYAERPILEKRLKRALSGHKFLIGHGESGNGKTWLYKRVLQEEKVPYQVLNLAKMHTEGSLNSVILAKIGELGLESIVSEKKEIDIGIRPGGMGGGVKEATEYKSYPAPPLEVLANEMYTRSPRQNSVLVLDNFEQIIDN